MLDLNATALKASIEMIMCLMRKETLYKEIKRVKRTLKSDALNGLEWPKRSHLLLMPTAKHTSGKQKVHYMGFYTQMYYWTQISTQVGQSMDTPLDAT